MSAPLVPNEIISTDYSLIIALLTGFGMGFFLERAGFGSAKKLVSQFYLFDMSVFKVMFTAIVTAMAGVYFLSATGLLNLDQVAMIGTYVWPQILGGFILGFGFIIGGYCPGTSAVACATGKIDGMVYAGGVLAGMFAVAEFYPALQNFINSSALGEQTLYSFFGISYGLLVVIVIVMALSGFWGATVVEKKLAHWKKQ